MRPRLILLSLAITLAGCAGHDARPKTQAVAQIEPEPTWRTIALPEDEAMLDAMTSVWTDSRALAQQRASDSLAKEGALVEAGAALDHPALPPGSYKCRVIRIGQYAAKDGFKSFPPFFCYVKSVGPDQLTLLKQTGTDLPSGWLYPDGEKRYVFLGAQQKAPGDNSITYATDRARDIAGVVERVGAFEWRMVVPHRNPDGLDIYVLTPVPPDQQPS